MAWFAAAAAAAAALGSAVLKKDGSETTQGIQQPIYNQPGYQGDNRGTTQAPPDPNAGPFPRTNQFLGSNIGKAISDIGGGFLSDFRAQRNTEKRHSYLKSKGLNSYEILGSSAGGPISSQGGTLGSGPATQINQQQSFVADQAQKDRDNKTNIAKITATAPRIRAGVDQQRSEREAKIAPLQRTKLQEEIAKIEQEVRRMEFDLDNIWPMKFATMGPENAKLALAMFNSGLDLERILTAAGDITDTERQQVEELYNILLKITGASGGAVGWMELVMQILRGQGTLNSEKGGPLNKLSPNKVEGKGYTSGGKGATGQWNTKNSRGSTGQWR